MTQLFTKASAVPISGLVVTFQSSVTEHAEAVESLKMIAEIDIGESAGSKLAIVIDSETKRRDQEIWDMVQQLPGVIDLAVAMVAFDEDDQAN
jgi:nitrate reductase NapAB chaperone NapD